MLLHVSQLGGWLGFDELCLTGDLMDSPDLEGWGVQPPGQDQEEGSYPRRSVTRGWPPHHRRLNQDSQEQEQQATFEYGSREADAAAQKLKSLGAIVYPPGNKAAIDWGILAGEGSLPYLSHLMRHFMHALGSTVV